MFLNKMGFCFQNFWPPSFISVISPAVLLLCLGCMVETREFASVLENVAMSKIKVTFGR